MSAEVRAIDFEERSQFTTIPNIQAERIENALGIHYPIKPILVPYEGQNAFKYFLYGFQQTRLKNVPFIAAAYITHLPGRFLRRNNYPKLGSAPRPFYDESLHACFVPPEYLEDRRIVLHENIHGLLRFLNPKFNRSNADVRVKDDPLYAEDEFMADVVNEGLSEWLAIEILRDSENDNEREIARDRIEILIGHAVDERHAQTMPDIVAALNTIEDMKDRLVNELESSKGVRRGRKILDINRQIDNTTDQYTVGYYFVIFAMQRLMRYYNMEKRDAFLFLAENVPTTFEDVKYPGEFIDKLMQDSVNSSFPQNLF